MISSASACRRDFRQRPRGAQLHVPYDRDNDNQQKKTRAVRAPQRLLEIPFGNHPERGYGSGPGRKAGSNEI